jgi:hypothetical protein
MVRVARPSRQGGRVPTTSGQEAEPCDLNGDLHVPPLRSGASIGSFPSGAQFGNERNSNAESVPQLRPGLPDAVGLPWYPTILAREP